MAKHQWIQLFITERFRITKITAKKNIFCSTENVFAAVGVQVIATRTVKRTLLIYLYWNATRVDELQQTKYKDKWIQMQVSQVCKYAHGKSLKTTRAELLELWLALTQVKYHDNL